MEVFNPRQWLALLVRCRNARNPSDDDLLVSGHVQRRLEKYHIHLICVDKPLVLYFRLLTLMYQYRSGKYI